MRVFEYRSEQWLPRPIRDVFPFFADAQNLGTITPDWLQFSIISQVPIEMRVGTLIDYRLRVRGFPIRWQSEITAWEPPFHFVDEQRRGPYLQWIHEHLFENHGDRTRVFDSVKYALWGGALINWLFVRRDVETIFAFRRKRLVERFG